MILQEFEAKGPKIALKSFPARHVDSAIRWCFVEVQERDRFGAEVILSTPVGILHRLHGMPWSNCGT